ncbi:MAG: hypothetical protein ACTTKL_08670 [Treponema sp.]
MVFERHNVVPPATSLSTSRRDTDKLVAGNGAFAVDEDAGE